MFWKIFQFEIQNRVRRPAVYLYFTTALVFTILSFATGSLPTADKEHFNAPYLIAMWCAGMTMLMMVITSSIMGTPLYRDIEHNTKDYYLTYPITKAGYFWGRFLGSFVFMLFISGSILFGAYFGSKLGPAMHWRDAAQYGPNHLIYYLYPYLTIALPNLIFTSCLFFGLVAITRNVKVIYSGGIILFLGYFLSIFFLNHTNNATVITLADPFALNGVRYQSGAATSIQRNTTLLPVTGLFLINRIIWSGIGVIILLYTYIRFSFEQFFSGKRDKAAIDEVTSKIKRPAIKNLKVSFTGNYNRSTLYSLVKIELNNIIRDNYFWIIISCGLVFLGFVFWMGDGNNGVPDFPRSVALLDIFNDVFLFFIFFIIIFYSGETLHRDATTRYAFINDSLPPPNWVLNGSKLITLLLLGFCLSLIPLLLGIPIQIAKGFYQFNFPIYFSYVFTIILPRLLEMVLFAYMVHVTINNKFVAHGIGIFFWIAIFFLHLSGIFNYNLLLYSYTPDFHVSDMDGLGHMAKPVYWFNIYWLLCGGLLIIIAALFYYRGVTSSFKERLQLLGQRFDAKTRLFTAILLLAFLGVGAYNYYNVSYLNIFLTKIEGEDRAILYEKKLKRYASLPLPKITRIKMNVDLFPDKQEEFVKAWVTLVNRTNKPIVKLLLDGDNLTTYTLKIDGQAAPFTCPLLYERGVFDFFRAKQDTADFRLYQFQKPLAPGDSAVVEINSSVTYKGFKNGLYAANILRNGTTFTGGLPGIGYDDDDEINSPYIRKSSGLPPKKEEEIAQNDPAGISTLKAGQVFDSLDITVSTSADQIAVAQGILQKQWKQNGRNYYHYIQTQPGMYAPIGIVSAKYTVVYDSVALTNGHKTNISIFYHPEHKANVGRFIAAYKDGIRYFTKAYGDYPFKDIRLAETSVYGPWQGSLATLDIYNERFGWNADFTNSNQDDYCYFTTTQQLAQQWWRFQVAPNSTAGSLVIPEGLAGYSAVVMAERKYGKNNMRQQLLNQLWVYLNIRHRLEEKERPLIRADKWFEWGGKASVVLYGLRDLIGEDSLNSALRDFKKEYAFRNKPPFAGANDLYRYLQKHVPDSLQYYLTDTWQKITLYDSKVTDVKATPTGKQNEYRVTLKVNVAKVYIDDKGNDIPVKNMNDYIDIGVFGTENKNKEGRSQINPLYLKKYRLTAGQHTITIIVKGKPASVGIDPYNKLIDRMPGDNLKEL
jgi:ABC-2 type transport system permease protein